jgi:amino acid adenylation domain-containing protein
LTQERLSPTLPAHEARAVCLDTDWGTIAQESETNPVSGVTPDNLAYVIYTSGSTGEPKGVTITHANICPLLHWGYQDLRLTPADRAVQYLSYCFDWSVWEMFIALTSGAGLLMVSGEMVLDPEATLDFMARNGVTVLHGTPTQFQYLIALGQRLETLTYACIGAETLPCDLLARCHDLLDANCRTFNMYGPTEAAIIATTLEIDRSGVSKYRDLSSVPIGRPVANARCHIVDRHNNLQPIGVPGELYIAGDGLARGYLNRPALTAEKFAPNPFGTESGSRLYRTGDLARYLPDGDIEFLGRTDYQVKIRGFRIEPGEIEAVLGQHPAVRETVVLAREDTSGDKWLVAYVVPDQGQEPAVGELRRFLQEKMPRHMVPSAFVTLEALPLTPNGKIDRRALPAPDRSDLKAEETFVAPRSLAEEVVVETWAQVFELERVSVYDNFFALGGHSLMATRILSRLCDAFQIEVSLRDFFEAPTVAELALVIEDTLIEGLEALAEDEAQRLAEQQKADYR